MQTEADETARESAKVMEIVRMELRNNAADIKGNITIGEKTRAAAEEASEKGKQIVEVVKELKDKAPPVGIHGQMSYAAAAASGMLQRRVHSASKPSPFRLSVKSS
jgi:gas vesicle protein